MSDLEDRPRLVFISTTDLSVHSQLRGQLGYLRQAGFEVTLIASDTGRLAGIAFSDGIPFEDLPMTRSPHPVKDLVSLVRLTMLLRKMSPDLVVYGTPKASLLGSLASRLSRVPRRVYFLYGLRAETATGLSQRFLLACEKFVIKSSTATLSVGNGLASRAIDMGLPGDLMRVIGAGSANGIDVEHFATVSTSRRTEQGTAGFVVGFVGRLTLDKGIDRLLRAVELARKTDDSIRLLLVGPDEGLADIPLPTRDLISAPWVEFTGDVDDTAPWYARMDLMCLPSLREGLPTVVLEAAAAGTPVLVTDFTGARDVVMNGVNGIVVDENSPEALARSILSLRRDPDLRRRLAHSAHEDVRRLFDTSVVWRGLADFYRGHLE